MRVHAILSAAIAVVLAALCVPTVSAVTFDASAALSPEKLLASAREASDWIVALRRTLHQIPEIGSKEFKTSALLKHTLDELEIKYTSVFGTGLVATIGTGEGPVVALRADMDALPIQEPKGLPFVSTHDGAMHACGHDGHMSMLLGAAKVLKSVESALPGTVRLIFQPNEEFGAGGDHVVKEGALDGVSAAFAFHVAPWIPSGQVGTRPGTILAGALSFHITLRGRGGHAAMPHLNVDPIVAAGAVITALQTLVSRETSPLGSAVLSITLLRAGDAYNVIPNTAELGGTIRALDHDTITRLQRRLEDVVAGVAAAHGVGTTEVDWRLEEQPYYPPTVNNPQVVQFTYDVAAQVLGSSAVHETEAIMAGEDMGFICRAVPCTMAFLGIRNDTAGSTAALHNPGFRLDEGVLHKGAAIHAAWAAQYLLKHAGQAGKGASEGHRTEL